MEHFENPKNGRPRQYTLKALTCIPDPDTAMAASMLQELRERVIDQVNNLALDALAFQPQGTYLSIGVLVIHLVWAEAGWISAITGYDVPAALRDDIHAIGQALPAGVTPPASTMDADALVNLCHRINDEVTVPALASYPFKLDKVIKQGERTMTLRGVLMHLIWHWTYHSGQIGLLSEQWGAGYTWALGTLGA